MLFEFSAWVHQSGKFTKLYIVGAEKNALTVVHHKYDNGDRCKGNFSMCMFDNYNGSYTINRTIAEGIRDAIVREDVEQLTAITLKYSGRTNKMHNNEDVLW